MVATTICGEVLLEMSLDLLEDMVMAYVGTNASLLNSFNNRDVDGSAKEIMRASLMEERVDVMACITNRRS